MKGNLIGYLESLKNYSISSLNDFNRVSRISGGLLFRWYHCSTFVTCQIIFPPACHVHLSKQKLPTASRPDKSDLEARSCLDGIFMIMLE